MCELKYSHDWASVRQFVLQKRFLKIFCKWAIHMLWFYQLEILKPYDLWYVGFRIVITVNSMDCLFGWPKYMILVGLCKYLHWRLMYYLLDNRIRLIFRIELMTWMHLLSRCLTNNHLITKCQICYWNGMSHATTEPWHASSWWHAMFNANPKSI